MKLKKIFLLLILFILFGSLGYLEGKIATNASELFSLAEKYESGKNFLKAIELYKQIINDKPDIRSSMLAKYKIGKNYQEMNEQEKALMTFQEILDDYGQHDYVYYAITAICSIVKNTQGSLGPLEKKYHEILSSLVDNHKKIRIQYLMAMVHYYQDKNDEAFSDLQKILKNYPLDPLIPDAYVELATYYRKKGDSSNAINIYENTINRYPDTVAAYRAYEQLLGIYSRDAKYTNKAFELSQDIVEKYPTDNISVFAHQIIGDVLESKGEYEKAITEYDKIISKFPYHPKIPYYKKAKERIEKNILKANQK